MKQDFEIKAHNLKYFKTKSANIAYDVLIPDISISKKQILLLVNGFQRTRQDFRAFRQKLAKTSPDTITVAFDNRFCGETEVFKNAEDTSLEDFALDALLLLKHCMEEFQISKVHVLGISMGGMISQILANLPECPKLSTLFLVSTTAGGTNWVWPKEDVLQLRSLDATHSYEDIAQRLAFYFGKQFLQKSPLLFKMFVQNMQKTLSSVNAEASVHAQATASKHFQGIPNFSELNADKIVIISGDEDQIIPVENSITMSNLVPNSHLIIYQGIGHLILIEDPNEFVQNVSQFLNKKDQ